MTLTPTTYLGIDSGLKGGGGLCVIAAVDGGFRVLEGVAVHRDVGMSEVGIICETVEQIRLLVAKYDPKCVGREDHNFLGHPERMSRNVLRRINGAIDYALCGNLNPYYPGDNYLAFPPGSWKAVAGIPGDIGKTSKGRKKGAAVSGGRMAKRFSKAEKGTKSDYLAAINGFLDYDWDDDNIADAHGVAVATARVDGARRGVFRHVETYPTKVRDAMWDRKACLGMTCLAFLKKCRKQDMDDETIRRNFGKFVRHFSP